MSSDKKTVTYMGVGVNDARGLKISLSQRKGKFCLDPELRVHGLDLFAAICVRHGVCCRAGTEHSLETQRKLGEVLRHV